MAGLLDYGAFGTGSPAETAQQPSGMAALLGGAYNAMGLLAKRALGNSANAVGTGTYNPAPVVEAAMLPMGTGAVAGVPVKGAETVLGAGPIRAYHGSPHDFDKFDLSKIGTGEGAQAYGHGLYFAENEGVAKAYRNQLSDAGHARVTGGMAPKEEFIFDRMSGGASEMDILKDFAGRYGGSFDDAMAAIEKVKGLNRGKMYEVNINADPAHFLDWDKPLSGQSGAVRSAIKPHLDRYYGEVEASYAKPQEGWGDLAANAPAPSRGAVEDRMTGQELYKMLQADPLRDAGIPGIKYLDQGSRGAGQGSRNFVVFDDKLIDIMRKYGLAGLPAAGVAYGAAQDQQ